MYEDMGAESSPSQNNDSDNSCNAYLARAAKACSAGDSQLGLHLYLAAYERGAHDTAAFDDAAHALRKAWVLAVQLKERSLAEYIFEKLEPVLDSTELAICAEQLQGMALDKLEEFGLSREDLQEMTEMISQDFLGFPSAPRLMKVEHLTMPTPGQGIFANFKKGAGTKSTLSDTSQKEAESQTQDSSRPLKPTDEESALAKNKQKAGSSESLPTEIQASLVAGAASLGEAGLSSSKLSSKTSSKASSDAGVREESALASTKGSDTIENADSHAKVSTLEDISYQDLAGYGSTIRVMRDFGIGAQDDPQFQDLVELLNARHGLEHMPAADSFLFRSSAREDAHRFIVATLGELGLPAIHMHMEENLQGLPVLCVMAQADNHPRLNTARNAFEGPGVLMLEDLDLWLSPVPDSSEELGSFAFATLSRGAREAINLIRSAVESPEVYVIASAADTSEIDPFFCDLLEPLTIVDIDLPTEEERGEIWMDIAHNHPSLRGIDQSQLVKFSSGLPRYDIYVAAREAIEDAYKESLVKRSYVAVSRDNLFEKLAAYQPLDSSEYKALEDAVVADFSRGLDAPLDDLLKDED